MIAIKCTCGQELEIFDARNLGDLVTIKVKTCECNSVKKCNDPCDEITELKDKLQQTITQQQIDIEGNDEMLQKVRKVSEKWGGMIQDEINEILEGEE